MRQYYPAILTKKAWLVKDLFSWGINTGNLKHLACSQIQTCNEWVITSCFNCQVMDPTFRAPFANVNRWFLTVVNQPQFKKILGEVKLCQTMAKFDGESYSAFHLSELACQFWQMESAISYLIKMESTRKLSNFNSQWTKTLYQKNFKNTAFLFTLSTGYRM